MAELCMETFISKNNYFWTCFSDQAADFNIYSLNKHKNFFVKKFFKIIQNGGAHGGSNSLMNGLLPP